MFSMSILALRHGANVLGEVIVNCPNADEATQLMDFVLMDKARNGSDKSLVIHSLDHPRMDAVQMNVTELDADFDAFCDAFCEGCQEHLLKQDFGGLAEMTNLHVDPDALALHVNFHVQTANELWALVKL